MVREQEAERSDQPAPRIAPRFACLSWAIDNNQTQRLSIRDQLGIVRMKALAAAPISFGLACHRPDAPTIIPPSAVRLRLTSRCTRTAVIAVAAAARRAP